MLSLFEPFISGFPASQQEAGPILGSIPWAPRSVYASLYPPSIAGSKNTLQAMAYEGVAASLMRMAPHTRPCLTLSSTINSFSPSWTAMHLAYALSRQGQNVLLVDADSHNPTLHLAFDLPAEEGLHLRDVLDADPSQHIQLLGNEGYRYSEHPLLWVLPNGKAPQTAQLTQPAGITFLHNAAKRFDCILLDAGPLVQDPQALAVAALSHGVVLLQDYYATASTMEAVQALLHEKRVPLCGVISRKAL